MPQKRILQIISSLDCGGVEKTIMENLRHIDKDEVIFDFTVFDKEEAFYYEEEARSLGCRIFRLPRLYQSGPINYVKGLVRIMNSYGPFSAVHVHDIHSGWGVLAAYIAKIPIRISHSRSAEYSSMYRAISKAYVLLMRFLCLMFSTKLLAVSRKAGEFLFGTGVIAKKKMEVLPNPIDLKAYRTHAIASPPLNIPEKTALVIGHAGRFSTVKNHAFLIRVFSDLLKKHSDCILVLAGDGPERESAQQLANELGIHEKILFLGVRNDIPAIMQAIDVFVFPSLYEGFPNTVLEAQAAGCPCVLADTISKEVDLDLGLVTFLSLESPISEWVDAIVKTACLEKPKKEICLNRLTELGYDVEGSCAKLMSYYGI